MATGVGVAELTDALKRCLRSRGMTYAGLAAELELSEASVKRLFSTRAFTMQRIEAICSVLGLDFYELARLARGPEVGKSRLTLEQERGLTADPKRLLVFQLLLNDWPIDQILKDYRVSRAEWPKIRHALEELGLITIEPGGAVRLHTARRIVWHDKGPVRRAYQKIVFEEFFQHRFGAGTELHFEGKELSAASIELMRRKIERLVHELNELAEMDSSLQPAERTSVGMVVALRPYVLSLFTRYKRT